MSAIADLADVRLGGCPSCERKTTTATGRVGCSVRVGRARAGRRLGAQATGPGCHEVRPPTGQHPATCRNLLIVLRRNAEGVLVGLSRWYVQGQETLLIQPARV